jgi:predicted nucleic acid-binding protein
MMNFHKFGTKFANSCEESADVSMTFSELRAENVDPKLYWEYAEKYKGLLYNPQENVNPWVESLPFSDTVKRAITMRTASSGKVNQALLIALCRHGHKA